MTRVPHRAALRGLALFAGGASAVAVAGLAPATASSRTPDAKVTVGSPVGQFPRNKANEPAVAVAMDAAHPTVLAAGANEEIDNAPCKGSDCGFTPGIGDSGIYFSFDAGTSWTQPTYRGWSARTGTPKVGPIGTIPGYYEAGLVSDGDPALAFGPKPGKNGFSWANGSRLYYANLTSNFPGTRRLNAVEALAVSRTDDVRAAAAGKAGAWKAPVIASRQLRANVFSDKEAIWVDNAASSRHFGSAYVCWTSYRGPAETAAPVYLARSTDGGGRWSQPAKVTFSRASAFTGASFCTIRTDSRGVVYVGYENGTAKGQAEQMIASSSDGGVSFSTPRRIASATLPGRLDPAHVADQDPRWTMDGLAGARLDAGLSLDIANGAPTGRDATDTLVAAWSDGRHGLNRETALVQTSRNGGRTWSGTVDAAAPGDRPAYTSVAISPNGTDVYVTYDAFLRPWQPTTRTVRPMAGVVRHTDLRAGGPGRFATLHRGATGDARGSSQNSLTQEFLGDYTYTMATRGSAAAVWSDVRWAADCPAIDKYRASLVTNSPLPKPAPRRDCPARFGNTDIYGGNYADPTP